MNQNTHFLPAEWHPQSCVQLTWPHAKTDWAQMLKHVEACYIDIAREIALRENLLIVTPEPARIESLLRQHLPAAAIPHIYIIEAPTDDTWARDHGFITLVSETQEPILLDFCFNGWGEKFEASQDNQICRRMAEQNVLGGTYESHLDFVLEGGSIESDGHGTILTTSTCLMAPHRNQPLTQEEIEQRLCDTLRAERILWLDHGYLAGDDTDSHVDTLARLCPNDTIAYVQCNDPLDEHYKALSLMEKQLRDFRTKDGRPYHLVPLPMPDPCYDKKGHRLPATYANFLVVHGAVLMPVYGFPRLERYAAQQLQLAFPDYEIVPINCRILIEQHGSLHCCTMQFPQEVSLHLSPLTT